MKRWDTLELNKCCTLQGNNFTGPSCKPTLNILSPKSVNASNRDKQLFTQETLQKITTTSPFEMVLIDCLHLEDSSGRYEYILVIMDHFPCFVQAYPTRNKSARTATEKLCNDFILHLGFPSKIYHDQGGESENQLFTGMEQFCNTIHSQTTQYHPQGNDQVERFNHSLLSMLQTLLESYKTN